MEQKALPISVNSTSKSANEEEEKTDTVPKQSFSMTLFGGNQQQEQTLPPDGY